jgi:hypothetical protein
MHDIDDEENSRDENLEQQEEDPIINRPIPKRPDSDKAKWESSSSDSEVSVKGSGQIITKSTRSKRPLSKDDIVRKKLTSTQPSLPGASMFRNANPNSPSRPIPLPSEVSGTLVIQRGSGPILPEEVTAVMSTSLAQSSNSKRPSNSNSKFSSSSTSSNNKFNFTDKFFNLNNYREQLIKKYKYYFGDLNTDNISTEELAVDIALKSSSKYSHESREPTHEEEECSEAEFTSSDSDSANSAPQEKLEKSRARNNASVAGLGTAKHS